MTPMRAQRFMMAIMLIVSLILIHTGHQWGEYIIWFMIFMLLLSAVTGFCPSDTIFQKIFGKNCSDEGSCS
ncbi:MAG TPA: DUF2892 domain-containing protein [Persephonella sp.]|nr:DUF2892 domain-containing protein [Hydrogenothermaceae bacterium]HIQ25546.1 DUF2892 domain-containing protein [Persephonella sp.]